MPLHLRRYTEIWPHEDWDERQYAVLTDAGQQLGTIQFHAETSNKKKWGWYINGEIVAGIVHSRGTATTLRDAADKMAKNWREFLDKTGKPENYSLPYGRRSSADDIRRLRLPATADAENN
jgi:hypothetical protein